MNYVQSDIDGVRVLKVDENLTFVNQKEFVKIIQGTIEERCSHVVLDISAMSFIGSMGIGLIAQFFNKLKAADGELIIVRPSEDICKVFTLTGLDRIIPFFKTVNEALESFGKKVTAKDVPQSEEGTDSSLVSKVRKLEDENEEVRRYVAWSLGLLGDPEAIPYLEKVLQKDTSKEVRDAASDALKKLTGQE